MRMDIKKAFREATAIVVFGLFGAAGGGAAYQQFVADKVDAKKTPASVTAVAKYENRLKALEEKQASLTETNDEDAAAKLAAAKRTFVADVILDTALTEKDAGDLSLKFKPLADDSSAVFRATADARALAQRNACLEDITLTKNRTETAQRVEDCMIVYAKKEAEGAKTAAGLGGLTGAALAGAFLLGRRTRRRETHSQQP